MLPPTPKYLQELRNVAPGAEAPLRLNPRNSDATPLGPITQPGALARALIMIREPRTCSFPCAEPEALGDAIEALLGFSNPDRPRDKTARASWAPSTA